MEEKIDKIIWILEDAELGLCARMRKMEKTVYGNGSPGIAESVRTNNRNWAIAVSIICISLPLVVKIFF